MDQTPDLNMSVMVMTVVVVIRRLCCRLPMPIGVIVTANVLLMVTAIATVSLTVTAVAIVLMIYRCER